MYYLLIFLSLVVILGMVVLFIAGAFGGCLYFCDKTDKVYFQVPIIIVVLSATFTLAIASKPLLLWAVNILENFK